MIPNAFKEEHITVPNIIKDFMVSIIHSMQFPKDNICSNSWKQETNLKDYKYEGFEYKLETNKNLIEEEKLKQKAINRPDHKYKTILSQL